MSLNIKLEREVLTLKLDCEKTYIEQREEVKAYLLKMHRFLENGEVKFSYDGVNLNFNEEMDLCSLADEAFGKNVSFCYKNSPPQSLMRHITSNGERLVRKLDRMVRAGEKIESNGDLIVVGDVNPTAQLTAYGDIYVIGNLRGIAHAGCMGDEKAFIYAMNMNPVMIKIADKIGFSQEKSRNNQNGIARLENGEIKVNMI